MAVVLDESSRVKASAEVQVAGQALDPALMATLELIRIKDEWMLPSAATLRFVQPLGDEFDWRPLDIGAALTVSLGATRANTTTPTFDGEVVAVEPDFLPDSTTWTIRALDRGHRLMRGTRTRTFLHMTAADVAHKLAAECGLACDADSAGGQHQYLLQAAESDWTYLWRHAVALGFTVRVEGRTLRFRRAEPDGDGPALEWGAQLRAFRPRRSAVSQVDEVRVAAWDVQGRQAITAQATSSEADIPGTGATGAAAFGTARLTAAEPVDDQQGADARAQAILDRLAAGRTEAEGVAAGDPAIRAGERVQIRGIADGWAGGYLLTRVEHVHRASAFETHFTVGGHAPRTLLDIVARAPARPDFGAQLVVGLVTDNDDPDQLGRVKVKFPTLGEAEGGFDVESHWARVATLGAGPEKGVAMMPMPDDEVVVAFESGDLRRPIVLGSVWNGRALPHADHSRGDGDGPDGSLVVRSDGLLVVETKADQTFTAVDGGVTTTSKGDNATTSQGDVTTSADGAVKTTAGGDIMASAHGSLSQEAMGDARVAGGGATTISGQAGVTVETSGSMTLRAAGTLTIQGSQVNITGGLINLG